MKIAIIGAGNVGATLGKRFAEVGNEVFYGVRNPSEYDEKELGGKVGTNAEACEDAEIIVLSVPYNVVEDAIKSCGEISGKIVVDATNPLGMTPNGLALTIGFETSGGEKLQEIIPQSKVVKCFNTTGFENMLNPVYHGKGIDMFTAGNSEKGIAMATQLSKEIGFGNVYHFGGNDRFALIEQFAFSWINLAILQKQGRDMAFTVVRR